MEAGKEDGDEREKIPGAREVAVLSANVHQQIKPSISKLIIRFRYRLNREQKPSNDYE